MLRQLYGKKKDYVKKVMHFGQRTLFCREWSKNNRV